VDIVMNVCHCISNPCATSISSTGKKLKNTSFNQKIFSERLQTEIGSLDKTACHYKRHDPSKAEKGTSDLMSINFLPTSLMEIFAVMNHIQDDLIVRGMQFDGDLYELLLLLIERLQMEHDLNELQGAIAACRRMRMHLSTQRN
jgi:hypothetical protein